VLVGRHRIDFAWPERRLGVELDGRAFHDGWNAQRRDASRQNELLVHGWSILRFTWSDVVHAPVRVVAQLVGALAA
jgi:very-short-patch-repair endonuclease